MNEKINKVTLCYDDYKGTDLYCDGEIEDRLLEIVQQVDPSEYDQVIETSANWPIMYHLSNVRENILKWYPFKDNATILEIGSGCGAVTGALCGKGNKVTCIDLSKKRSLINAYRHKGEAFTIHVGNFEDIHLEEKFDYVTLIGVLEYGGSYIHSDNPYVDFLKKAKSYLKPDGKLLIAIENKLGLKYWAGCREDHVGKFFESIEGYPNTSEVKTFTRKELKDILLEVGFYDTNLYYPYPDYKFAHTIFSDKRLPSQGECNDNIRNFDMDRLELFDETKVFNTMIDNHMFQDFSNSFFAEASLAKLENDITYAKFSQSNRAREFQVKTCIHESVGHKFIIKEALYDAGMAHIKHMLENYSKLQNQYKNTDIQVVTGEMVGDNLKFSYAEGRTLEYYLNKLAKQGNYMELIHEIENYFKILFSTASLGQPDISLSSVFGTIDTSVCMVMENMNIDALFNNVKLQDNTYKVFDYEWMLDGNIPIDFIKYRCLFYFQQENANIKHLNLYEIFGISDENQKKYFKMEESFQKYVLKGKLVDNQLHTKLGQITVHTEEVLESYKSLLAKKFIQIYLNKGNGYLEKDSMKIEVTKNNDHYRVEFMVPDDIVSIRIDPMEGCGVINIEKLFVYHPGINVCRDLNYVTNGKLISENHYLYLTDDPVIEVEKYNLSQYQVVIEFEAWILEKDFACWLGKQLDNKSISKRNQNVDDNADNIIVCIDQVVTSLRKVTLTGWAVTAQGGKVSISTNLKKANIQKISRSDVAKSYCCVDNNIGFRIEVSSICRLNVMFESGNSKKIISYSCLKLRCKRLLVLLKKVMGSLKKSGFNITIKKILCRLRGISYIEKDDREYEAWYESHKVTLENISVQKTKVFSYMPTISLIIPVYNTPINFLKEVVESIKEQTYENWELILVDGHSTNESTKEFLSNIDDSKIRVLTLEKNMMISGNTNEGIKIARGDYIGLVDHDDLLTPDALYCMVEKLNEKKYDMIYSDEDKINEDSTRLFQPHFKPDFCIDTLRSYNYITHFTILKKTMLDRVGYFDSNCDGAQDYDMFLRFASITDNIAHVHRILYHWRAHESSTAKNSAIKEYVLDAGKLSLKKHLEMCGLRGTVFDGLFPTSYHVCYEIKGEPLISIIIPNKDHVRDLKKCLKSIQERTIYKNYEILIVENNSSDEETFSYYQELNSNERIKILYWNDVFNYSAINNYAVNKASGDYIVLLNNDIEIITKDWIREMLMFAQRADIGAVGAKLYYPNNTIQHAGVILGIGGVAGHSHKYYPKDDDGYCGRLKVIQNVSAVTAACLMINKSKFKEVGGLDEGYKVAFNDIDFCMKLLNSGYKAIFTPYVEMIHYESLSRGSENSPEKVERFNSEIKLFEKKWGLWIEDSCYNRNLTIVKEDFGLRKDE